MLISREVDYGVRILCILCEANKKMDANELATITKVSIRFTLKILGKLTTASIVQSFRGAKGGYQLAKDPAEINLYEIIVALDGGLKINGCFEEKSNCSSDEIAICGLRRKLFILHENIKNLLEQFTLDSFKTNQCFDYVVKENQKNHENI